MSGWVINSLMLAEVTLRAPHVEVRSIDQRRHGLLGASNTFHGRDVFSVIAGRLAARQLAFADVGELAHLQVPSPIPGVVSEGDSFVGCVLLADHFGNLITNLTALDGELSAGSFRTRKLRRAYGEAAPGDLLALMGSHGFVEIAAREASASALLGLARGDAVMMRR